MVFILFSKAPFVSFLCFFQLSTLVRSVERARFPMNEHSDVVIISDKIPDWYRRAYSFQNFAHVPTVDGLEGIFRPSGVDTVLVVVYGTVEMALDAVAQIPLIDHIKADPTEFLIIFRWPVVLNDETEVINVIESDAFYTGVSNYTINYKLIGAFKVETNVTTSNTAFPLLYHIYTINNIINYSIFKAERVGAVLNCGICSTPLAEMNAHGQLIKVKVNMEAVGAEATLQKYPNPFDGFNKALFLSFTNKWNFSFVTIKTSAQDVLQQNGSWSGVIADVVNENADIGMIRGIMLPSRAARISYLPPLVEDSVAAFFLQPEANSIRDIFLEPFQTPLWLVAFFTWLLYAISMAGFTRILRKFGATGSKGEPDQSSDSFIMMLTTVTNQGWDEHPKASSLRTIFICASITGVIVYAGYSAAIVSTLSTKDDLIKTPSALQRSHLKIGMREDFPKSDLNVYKSNNDIIATLRMHRKDSDRMVNVSHAIHLMRTTPFAYVNSHVQMYEAMRSTLHDWQICKISELRVISESVQFGLFTSKKSPYREFFRRIITLSRERGFLWRWKRQFLYVHRCEEVYRNSGKPLGGNDVFSAFMILLGGHILSLTILCAEKLLYRKTNLFAI